jgi:hypothetical protein
MTDKIARRRCLAGRGICALEPMAALCRLPSPTSANGGRLAITTGIQSIDRRVVLGIAASGGN